MSIPNTYTAKYTKISSVYMVQLVEWPEVVTESQTLEECRELLKDALHEMILVYRQDARVRPSFLGFYRFRNPSCNHPDCREMQPQVAPKL
jgi:predicted RNase H-like HicB family nuclease